MEFPETNLSLIARLQELGDETSWAEFLRIYQPVVYRLARQRGLQEADAQDVVQQVFVSISRSIEDWRGELNQSPFRAWLTTIARNAVLKAVTRRPRDRAAGTSSVMDLLYEIPDHEEAASEFEIETLREIVRRAAEQIRTEFTAETWTIFWQTAIEGVSIAEVADSMRRTPGSIYVARHRVVARLKVMVQEMSRDWGLQEGGSPS
jgi:RNA polymerase sigma-70 factor (ECF subfamily)